MSGKDYCNDLIAMASAARAGARKLALMSSMQKNRCLEAMADELIASKDAIAEANQRDLEAGKTRLSSAMLDRLELTDARIENMAQGFRTLTGLADPVGKVLSTWLRPNGLEIRKVSVPIGVIAIIYESRPNVTADATGLCIKSGNTVVLRGGSEAVHSNRAIVDAMLRGGRKAELPEGSIQLLPWTDRAAVQQLLKMNDWIDLVIPRGGEGLIRTVAETSTIPVIKHYKGVCHVYVHQDADTDMALSIIENAKCQRPGVCNAAETVLIHRDIAETFAPQLAAKLGERDVELRGDETFCRLVPAAAAATEDDWREEYLDLTLSVRIVDNLEQAVDHIAQYGSAHSDAIVTSDKQAATRFTDAVDSACVYVNASTRFTDGGQFGMGAEIGVSTDRIHARGPMGIDELTTYKYVVSGDGQVR